MLGLRLEVYHTVARLVSHIGTRTIHMLITVSVSCVFPIRDCSLGGICDPSKRVCVCDAWFTNSTCNLLNLQPAVIGNGLDLRARNYHSWYRQCSIEKNYLADSLPTIGEVIVFKILKIPIFIMVIFLLCATMKLSHPGPQHQVQILFYFILPTFDRIPLFHRRRTCYSFSTARSLHYSRHDYSTLGTQCNHHPRSFVKTIFGLPHW